MALQAAFKHFNIQEQDIGKAISQLQHDKEVVAAMQSSMVD
jgi:hypothetical protein